MSVDSYMDIQLVEKKEFIDSKSTDTFEKKEFIDGKITGTLGQVMIV